MFNKISQPSDDTCLFLAGDIVSFNESLFSGIEQITKYNYELKLNKIKNLVNQLAKKDY